MSRGGSVDDVVVLRTRMTELQTVTGQLAELFDVLQGADVKPTPATAVTSSQRPRMRR